MHCVACSGKGQNTKGDTCKACQGSGTGNAVIVERVTDREQLAQHAQFTLNAFRAIPCETEEDFARCSEGLRALKSHINSIDERRKRVTKPLNAAVKEVNSWFNPILTVYREGEQIVKDKLTAYQEKQHAQRLALLAEVQHAHTRGDYVAAIQVSGSMQAAQPGTAPGISFREVWKFEVTDPAAVPREFLAIDERAVRAHMARSEGEPSPVPGIRFYKDTIVAAKAG